MARNQKAEVGATLAGPSFGLSEARVQQFVRPADWVSALSGVVPEGGWFESSHFER